MSSSIEAYLQRDDRRLRRARIARWSVLGVLAALLITFFVLSAYGDTVGWQVRVVPILLLFIVPLGLCSIYVPTWLGWWVVKRFRGGGKAKRGVRLVGVVA